MEPLAATPTALLRSDALSDRIGADVWLKRDDRTAALYGGNKVRKLELHLGAARAAEADALVTSGAAGSHHLLATALHASRLGFDVHALALPRVWSPHAEANLRLTVGAGAEVHPVRSFLTLYPAQAALVRRLRREGRRPFVIPAGGSNALGALGYVEAGLELAAQIEAPTVREPDAVLLPLGTCATAAGLSVGLAAAGVTAQVIAVRVAPPAVAHARRVRRLIGRVVDLLRHRDERFPHVARPAGSYLQVDGDELGAGYGHATQNGRRARGILRETEGLELDLTYGAKAFASLLRRAHLAERPLRVVFLHTLSSADLGPRLEAAPPLPYGLRQLFSAR